MPCYDHRDYDSSTNDVELQKKIDLYASWLCCVLEPMPEQIIAHLPLELQKWWNEHQTFDIGRGT